jgi:hypothetical protein
LKQYIPNLAQFPAHAIFAGEFVGASNELAEAGTARENRRLFSSPDLVKGT